MAHFFPLPPLLLVALLLSGCVTTGGENLFSLWGKGTPSVVASGGVTSPEEEEEEEGEEPLDAWLQALTYRSPDYGLQPPERKNTLKEALQTAFALQGTPYRFGGTSEEGLDCSGLVWLSFANAGIKLPRSSQEQFFATERIGRSDLRPGDLVFFKTGRIKKRAVDHVGIYIGNNQFLHAPRRGKRVSVASLDEQYWRQRYVGAGRVPLDKADRSDQALASLPPDDPPQPTRSDPPIAQKSRAVAEAAPSSTGGRSSASASRHEAKRVAQNQKSPPPTKVASHNAPLTAKATQQKREKATPRQDRTPRQVAAQQATKAKPPSSAQAAQSPSPAKSTAQPANRSRSPTPSASGTASGKAPAKKETAKRDNAVAIR